MNEENNGGIIFEDLSGKIIKASHKVQNHLGVGRPEKVYHDALAIEFRLLEFRFQSEVVADLTYRGIKVGARRFDFLVEDKIVVELKIAPFPSQADFEQIREYLKMSGYKLGLLILFTHRGVKVYRVPNLY